MRNFKLFGGYVLDDLGQYSRDYIKNNCDNHNDILIYVGSDSKQLRKHTLYATVVAFYHVGRGAHIVFKRDKVKKIKDQFTRLYKEVEYVAETAQYLNKELEGHYSFQWTEDNIWIEIGGIKAEKLKQLGTLHKVIEAYNSALEHEGLVTCDLDLNPNPYYKSNMVYEAGVGLIKGLNFRVRTKPNAYAASSAADLICNKY